MVAAMALLRKGGRTRAVDWPRTEDDPNDHSVGYSGLPNLDGRSNSMPALWTEATCSGAVAP